MPWETCRWSECLGCTGINASNIIVLENQRYFREWNWNTGGFYWKYCQVSLCWRRVRRSIKSNPSQPSSSLHVCHHPSIRRCFETNSRDQFSVYDSEKIFTMLASLDYRIIVAMYIQVDVVRSITPIDYANPVIQTQSNQVRIVSSRLHRYIQT